MVSDAITTVIIDAKENLMSQIDQQPSVPHDISVLQIINATILARSTTINPPFTFFANDSIDALDFALTIS
jgi:hypothetical protein